MNRHETTGILAAAINAVTEAAVQDAEYRREPVDAERKRARLAAMQQTRIDMYHALFGTREDENNG